MPCSKNKLFKQQYFHLTSFVVALETEESIIIKLSETQSNKDRPEMQSLHTQMHENNTLILSLEGDSLFFYVSSFISR